MADAAPLLEVESIETCYGLSQVLFGMSLSVRSGEMVALMGRNGMGKTTTIRSIMGLTPARAGASGSADMTFAAFPSFKIAHWNRPRPGRAPDISQPDRARKSGRRVRQSPGKPRSMDDREDLRAVPAAGRARRQHGRTLSGGEQQMLAIGRALMTNPRLLILDEATEGLAPLIREEIWNCLSMLKRAASRCW